MRRLTTLLLFVREALLRVKIRLAEWLLAITGRLAVQRLTIRAMKLVNFVTRGWFEKRFLEPLLFRPASEESIEILRSLGACERVVQYYREREPADCIEGQVRIWSVKYMRRENTRLVPGCDLVGKGFLVFASTRSGDAYCFDQKRLDNKGDPRIVLFSHEVDFAPLTYEEVSRYGKEVASNYQDFMSRFRRDRLDEKAVGPSEHGFKP